MTTSNSRRPFRVVAESAVTLFRKKAAAVLAVALSGAVSPALAAESETTLYKSFAPAPRVETACQPGGVLVGVKGYQSHWIYSMQPVCVNTQGGRWTSATYTGAAQGMNFGAAFSSVCPANTVVKSLSGRLHSSLGQIQLSCQALNDAGAYVGPITNLPAVGGFPFGIAQTATCGDKEPPKGLIGTYLRAFSGFGMSCGTRAEGLKGISIPTPSNLYNFVANKNAAVALGKMLFWDQQVGSDSVQACASCHFHAGADNRSKNQLSPGLARASSPTVGKPDTKFQLGGPNYQLAATDYPFHQRANPDDYYSPVVRNLNDVTASQGVFNSVFNSAGVGQYYDDFSFKADPVFNVGGNPTRRVEPRNTPTTINAVFNFRNFWDGRAQYLFNGVNPFGARDGNARVFRNVGGTVQPVQVRIDNASLASQAVGPPSSNFEMSADGRTLMDIAKRLLDARPLALQHIAPDDSVLGSLAGGSTGLNTPMTYADIIRTAFKPEWWSGTQAVQVDASGGKAVIAMPGTLAKNQYTQMQANFSLFFGLAIQLYESTLVSDDSPYDRYMAGNFGAMSPDQKTGMSLFFGKGKCVNCHGGAEFTNASVRKTLNEPLQRMVMGNGGVAVYDEGFYNIAVTPTLEDILNGGRDAFGKPLSNTAIAQQYGSAGFQQMIGISPNITVSRTERIAVMGAAKTATVRNIELMNPHFHNGGALNLKHVLEFYNRGGNFKQANINDVDSDITPLGLSATEKNQIIAFMKSLTDDRVRRDAAPFDHPELQIPNGHPGNQASVTVDGAHAKDQLVRIPAIGRGGAAGAARPNFLRVVE
ncbi:cytochrome-c peroxidase [Methylocystis parvus]|uniref:cytochrome-c peroxidase n=1 Tax=Methylocystis parvus TaxID=134 RepID=UPI003C792DD6